MPITRRAEVLDQDITAFIVSYGKIEDVKSALFSTGQLFMAEYAFTVDNTKKVFSPGAPGSLLNGGWYNGPVKIYRNEALVFDGFLKKVVPDPLAKTCILTATNVLGLASDSEVVIEGSGLNPAVAAYQALVLAGLEAYLDENSFLAAQGGFSDAGATITLNYGDGHGDSGLSIANDIADLCSLALVTRGTKIYCQAFKAYPGNGSGLGPTVEGKYVRHFGELEFDDSGYANTVTVTYGASLKLTVENQIKVRSDGLTRSLALIAATGDDIAISDYASALYIGQQALARVGYVRKIISVLLGPEFESIVVGDRHPITEPQTGLAEEPFEATEVRKLETTDDIETVFVSLR